MLSKTNNDAMDDARNNAINAGKNGMNINFNRRISNKIVSYRKILQFWILAAGLTSSTWCFAFGYGRALLDSDAEYADPVQTQPATPAPKATKGKAKGKDKDKGGWKLKSEGGLSYTHPDDERFWFTLGGTVRLDQIHYSGDVKDRRFEFPNSARIRRCDVTVDGGVGEHWEYSFDALFVGLGGSFNSHGGPARQINTASVILQDVWLGYIGIFGEKSEIFFGRVSGNWYGLENATSSTWMPFLERSAQSNAFYPGDGIGVMIDKWWCDAGLTLIGIQPDQGRRIFTTSRPILNHKSDAWTIIGRFTYAPVHCLGDVWHFGVSGAWRENDPVLDGHIVRDFSVQATPTDVVSRNSQFAVRLLSTGSIPVSYSNQWAVEAARQCGPFILAAEYSEFYTHRVFSPFGSLRFKGLDIHASYLLTGEAHKYDVRDGNFTSIDICSPYGAWEVAARYDYLNLNDKDIHGGSQDCYTLGLNWFVNPVVRFSVNYVKCILRPANTSPPPPAIDTRTRNIDVIAFRAQLRFK